MLQLNQVTLEIQPLGTACIIFMVGKKEDIERQFWSFQKNMATNKDEPEWWTDNVACFSTTMDAAIGAFQRAAWWELLNNENFLNKARKNRLKGNKKNRPKLDPYSVAVQVGWNRFHRMSVVNWKKFDGASSMVYNYGSSVKAEKDTGNFNDDVLTRNVNNDLRGYEAETIHLGRLVHLHSWNGVTEEELKE